MNYILAIDQGSTHTRAAVCDEQGNLLGIGHAPGASHAYSGLAIAMAQVQAAAGVALLSAGVMAQDVAFLSAGLTGADWSDEYILLANALRQTGLGRQVSVHNDTIIALRGGTRQPYGAILVAGTGANCGGISPAGEEFLLHYYVEDDLQGGTAVGEQALKAIYRAESGREPPTRLTVLVLGFYGYKDVDELLRTQVEGRLPPESKKDLAPLVFEAAFEGDEVAGRILRRFGSGWAELVLSVLRHLDMMRLEVEVVLSGSVLKGKGPLLTDSLAAGIHRYAPRARLVHARYEPVVGAALLGLEACHIPVDEDVQHNIELSAQRLNLIRNIENQFLS